MTSARCYDSAQHNRAQGRCVGTPPYGWRALGKPGDKNRKLVPVEEELELVRLAKRLRASGWTLQAICDELHRLGRLSRCGRKWAPNQIARLCVAPEPTAEELAA
jgi:hypothetical protein